MFFRLIPTGRHTRQNFNSSGISGNRTVRGDGQQRAFVEKTLCRILKVIFGVSIPDSNAPFRLMTASYLNDYIPKMPRNYNLPNVMLTAFSACYHRNIR